MVIFIVVLIILIIIVNYYEISKWEIKFIELWNYNELSPFVPVTKLFKIIYIPQSQLIYKIFSKYVSSIDYKNFIEFICVFGFLSINEILKCIFILLYFLDVFIVYDFYDDITIQCNDAITMINDIVIYGYKMNEFLLWLSENKLDGDIIQTSILYEYLINNVSLLYTLIQIKNEIIQKIITQKGYFDIIRRKSIFDAELEPELIPKISCTKKIECKIKKLPHPYYSSYRKNKYDIEYKNSDIIDEIYKKYNNSKLSKH